MSLAKSDESMCMWVCCRPQEYGREHCLAGFKLRLPFSPFLLFRLPHRNRVVRCGMSRSVKDCIGYMGDVARHQRYHFHGLK